jgi:hypothetical protein
MTQLQTNKGGKMAELTEEKYREIENDLIRLCKNVAIPRFIKALRNAIELDLFESRMGIKGVALSETDFNQEFVSWISYGNLDTNFENKNVSYLVTRRLENWEEGRSEDWNPSQQILDDDIPF